MSAVRQELQKIVNTVNTSPDTQRHTPLPVPILRQTIPPEVGHEETHLHPHRYVICILLGVYLLIWLWTFFLNITSQQLRNISISFF